MRLNQQFVCVSASTRQIRRAAHGDPDSWRRDRTRAVRTRSGAFPVRSAFFTHGHYQALLYLNVFPIRFCCVPVDFEVVNVDSAVMGEDDITNAIMAIRRNGVALKGDWTHSCPTSLCSPCFFSPEKPK